MKKIKHMKSVVFLIISVLVVCTACSNGSDKTVIKHTDNGWDSQKLHNEIAKIVVENAFDGYTFEPSTGSSTMNWQAMINGDIDLDIESWTDNVVSYPEDVKNGDIIDIGVLVPDSSQGIYVPRYVIEGDAERGIKAVAPDLRTVEDLKYYADCFPDDEDKNMGRIYGAIPGWMADEIIHAKYLYYGLDETYNYARLGSEATLWASLESAYNLGVPWVGYCYEPTWVSGKLDIVRLEDKPYSEEAYKKGECEFPAQKLKIVSSNKFAERAPELVEFFSKYQTGSKFVSEGLAYLDETKATYNEAAVWCLKNHDDVLEKWLPKEKADRVREYLEGK